MQARRIRSVQVEGSHLRVVWSDGGGSDFHPIWLCENSSLAIDKVTGQRTNDAFAYPLDLAVASVRCNGDCLSMTFSDGRQGFIEITTLATMAWTGKSRKSTFFAPQPWTSTTAIPEPIRFNDYVDHTEHRLEMLSRLVKFGFAFMRDVPAISGGLESVTEKIGPIKQTNFGRIEDVIAMPNPTDLTLTTRGIEPHTDNPYRWPTPGYTVLHCLRNEVAGGESTLVDGLAAVSRLESEAPDLLGAVSRISPIFRYQDRDTFLEASGPLVETGADGVVRQIRFSNRTEFVPALPLNELDSYYAGRQRLGEILRDPALVKRFRFEPGMLVVMDNYRCLHGRQPYEANAGTRHLQLCFLDRDVVTSRLRVLMRDAATQS